MSSKNLTTGLKQSPGNSAPEKPSTQSRSEGIKTRFKKLNPFSRSSKKENLVNSHSGSSRRQDDPAHSGTGNADENLATPTELPKISAPGASNAVRHEEKPEPSKPRCHASPT